MKAVKGSDLTKNCIRHTRSGWINEKVRIAVHGHLLRMETGCKRTFELFRLKENGTQMVSESDSWSDQDAIKRGRHGGQT